MTTSAIFTYAILGAATNTLLSLLFKVCIKLLVRILHMFKQKFIFCFERIVFRIGRRIERKQ